jgi:hypothetical protein
MFGYEEELQDEIRELKAENEKLKLRLSDVRQRLIDRIDELKKDKRIMFGDENYVYKAPMGD